MAITFLYLDDDPGVAHSIIDILKEELRKRVDIGKIKKLPMVKTQSMESFSKGEISEFVTYISNYLVTTENIVIIDHNLDNIRFKDGATVGADIWKMIKQSKPFAQIYILTSDEEHYDIFRTESGIDTIFDKENISDLVDKALEINASNNYRIEELKNLISQLKSVDSPKMTVLRLESIIDELAGISNPSNNEIVDETMEELIKLADEIIKKYQGEI